ncbi:hypothetical protein [Bacillus sp. 2205SS5-2]|uniref:hypothetical protein n=1 Tax=Bacillus sp. 2205SS5-2 TaxID=3109031 RepID=UPI003007577B
MIRIGVSLIILALILLTLSYLALISFIQAEAFVDKAYYGIVAAILIGFIGSLILIIGVYRDRLKEKKEEENNDYSKY